MSNFTALVKVAKGFDDLEKYQIYTVMFKISTEHWLEQDSALQIAHPTRSHDDAFLVACVLDWDDTEYGLDVFMADA